MSTHGKIDYLEFPSTDLAASKRFFAAVFDWAFEDYGPDYVAFNNAGIDGGFYRASKVASADHGSALIVFYSDKLEATEQAVRQAGGNIVKPIFDFPGGRRFHFTEPGGSEFAVWAE